MVQEPHLDQVGVWCMILFPVQSLHSWILAWVVAEM